MSTEHLHQYAFLIRQERDQLLAEWRAEVRELPIAKDLDVLTLNDHIPALLEELARELEESNDETMIQGLKSEPIVHGLERLKLHFDVEEVVAEYNALRSVLQKLIEKHNLNQRGTLHHTLNRVIDRSIGLAVKTYSEQRSLEVQQQREEYLMFVTHDLRSPLSAIALATRLLEQNLSKSETNKKIIKYLNDLHINIGNMDELIKKVVQEESQTEISAQKLQRQEIKPRILVDNILIDFHPLLEVSNVKAINHIPEEIKSLADQKLLTSIFQNLISNAIKYTPNGEICIGAKALTGDLIEYWVKDNGTGIAEDKIDKIFNKYETDPNSKEGIGLGLAIVKKFVEAHQGTITVDSKPGSGSTFRFTLPNTPN